jgi:hypothetical protein
MALPSAQTVAAKWVTRTSAAAQDYAQGVAQTDVDPTQRAIQAQSRLRSEFIAAIDSGKWAQRLQAVGKAGWQQAVASKGVQNFSTGVAAAEQKVAAAFGPLLSFEQGLQSTIQAMPNVTDADRNNRMLAWANGMRQYQAP